MDVRAFVDASLRPTRTWMAEDVERTARWAPPEGLFGPRRGNLLRGDIHTQWSLWFVESLADPARYIEKEKTYAHVVVDVLNAVQRQYPGATRPEQTELAEFIADLVWSRTTFLRTARARKVRSREERLDLLTTAGSPPRCWICGHAFSEAECEAFLGEAIMRNAQPFVDVLRPSGLRDIDHVIQIEHIAPWSRGGEDDAANLALACSWCNRHKAANRSTYDVQGSSVLAGPNKFGLGTLPRHFWTVRLLAIQGRCEDPSGCSAATTNSELTVQPINPLGAMVPSNLRVVCPSHHWLGHERLQTRAVAAQLWGVA